jgi:hypothetical protein
MVTVAIDEANMELPELPNWSVETEEVSAGVYRLSGTHSTGASFETKGTDIVMLVQQLEEYAEALDRP